MPTKQFCTTKHPNFAFIQFYQRCVLLSMCQITIVCSQVAICLLTELTCVWLRFFLKAKRSSTLDAHILLNSQPNQAISTTMGVPTNCGQLLPIGGGILKRKGLLGWADTQANSQVHNWTPYLGNVLGLCALPIVKPWAKVFMKQNICWL